MRFARTLRTATVTAAIAVTAAVAAPATTHAAPAEKATAGEQTIPLPDKAPDVDPEVLKSLGAFAPALIGSVATRDADGNVNGKLLTQARELADNPTIPAEASDTWRSLIDFLGEPGRERAAAAGAIPGAEKDAAEKKKADDAPNIPSGPDKPKIQEFLYPTIGIGCMPGGNSVGMALTTAGPQEAPAPGPKRGQAGFVYTSLGTGPAKNNNRRLWASWLNLETGRTGQTALKPNPKINAGGPGTFTGIAKTGRGRIVSTIYGDVTTRTKGRTVSCTIAPTIGTAII
ncbi:hypothetical protein [Gordonia zhaorongruii]|uniref:Rv1157c family protein n=1 Tax=Gordonia zhaorongruii TaxID=2597659 RepID=UPI00104866F1|nr:hypothetical protein [Gordonia zhaorongruii]